MNCRRQTRRIDQLLLGQLSASHRAQLSEHLGVCVQCGRYYNRAVFVMRQLAGAPGEVCAEELALIGPAVALEVRPARFPWQWWALGTAGLVVTLAVVTATVLRTGSSGEAGEVQVRGEGRPTMVILRAYCVTALEPGNLQVLGSSDQAGRLKCGLDQLLQFSYRLDGNRPAWLYLAGVDPEGNLLRYYPRPSENESLRLQPGSSEQPLPGSIRLSARHHPGVVKVVGLITAQPLTEADGDARVKRAVADGEAAGDLRLTVEVIAQAP